MMGGVGAVGAVGTVRAVRAVGGVGNSPRTPERGQAASGGIEGCIKNNLCQSFDSFYAINFGKGCEPDGQFLNDVILRRS